MNLGSDAIEYQSECVATTMEIYSDSVLPFDGILGEILKEVCRGKVLFLCYVCFVSVAAGSSSSCPSFIEAKGWGG